MVGEVILDTLYEDCPCIQHKCLTHLVGCDPRTILNEKRPCSVFQLSIAVQFHILVVADPLRVASPPYKFLPELAQWWQGEKLLRIIHLQLEDSPGGSVLEPSMFSTSVVAVFHFWAGLLSNTMAVVGCDVLDTAYSGCTPPSAYKHRKKCMIIRAYSKSSSSFSHLPDLLFVLLKLPH